MTSGQIVLAGCAATILGVGQRTSRPLHYRRQGRRLGAHAGQHRPDGRHRVDEHRTAPPTGGLNRIAGNAATSPEDAQKQMQGQPTAAQEAQGAHPSAKMTDQLQTITRGSLPAQKTKE
jgi:hypothetical protein